MSENAEPAPSIHVWWKGDIAPNDIKDGWVIRNTVEVADSHKATYFCTIGTDEFYGGIQELENYKKVGIFSVWNTARGRVKEMKNKTHPKCKVLAFGGEGEGLKCIREIDWAIGDKITQKIIGQNLTGEEPDGEEQVWKLTSSIKVTKHDGANKSYKLATLKWTGAGFPLPKPSFYSFIEDWDRSMGADGYKYPRQARFTDPQITPVRPLIKMEHGSFTQSTTPMDNDGAKKCIIRQQLINRDPTKILMQTGGNNTNYCGVY